MPFTLGSLAASRRSGGWPCRLRPWWVEEERAGGKRIFEFWQPGKAGWLAGCSARCTCGGLPARNAWGTWGGSLGGTSR